MDDKLQSLIWSRQNDENRVLSLSGLLTAYNMGQYTMSCEDRIADAELIDGEHVQIDFINFPTCFLTAEG